MTIKTNTLKKLLKNIEKFQDATGMKDHAMSRAIDGSKSLIGRLKHGSDCYTFKMDQINDYMKNNWPDDVPAPK